MSQYTPRDDHELGAFSSSESAPEHKAPRTTYLREEPFDHDGDDGVFVAAPAKPMDIPADVDIADDMHGSHHNSLSDAEDEKKPWYSIFSRFFTWLVPYGGLFSNVLTLCSVTLGGGIIGMAHSFATSGIVMAIIYLVIVTTITIYTLTILGIVIRKIGVRNYEETGHVVFGRWGGYFVGFVLALSCTGTSISYISAAGSLVSPILLLAPGTPDYLKTRNGNRVIVVLIWLCLLVPVIIPKHVNSLRYVAFVAVFFVLYFVLCIVVHSCMNGLQEGVRDDMVLFSTGNRAIYSLSIYIFSFMNQGPIYSICLEMQPKLSIKQLTAAATIACVVCCIFYILAGVFGYLDFGSNVESSVLYNFDPVHEPYIMVAYIGMLIKICAAFSVNMIPLRNYLYYVLRWDLETTPYWRHSLLVVTFSGIVLVAGLFIPSISLAFGLVGSACGGFIGFIFPALFWMYSGNWTLKSVGIWNYIACHFLLVCGVIAIVWGTIATIYSSFFDDSM